MLVMPMYFFDLHDGDKIHVDDMGVELPDVDAARRALVMTLPRITAEKAVKAGDVLQMAMTVRNATDQRVLTAELTWKVRASN